LKQFKEYQSKQEHMDYSWLVGGWQDAKEFVKHNKNDDSKTFSKNSRICFFFSRLAF